MEFTGTSLALCSDALQAAAATLGVGLPEIWAVVAGETAGCGYLMDRRPKILFEQRYFSQFTGGKYDASHPTISSMAKGGYASTGAGEYDRLIQAAALDEDAALRSASWGLAQVMGDHHQMLGYADAQSMVEAMAASEDAHIAAFCGFIQTNNLAAPLAAHNWAAVAEGYNGKNYAENNYDKKLCTNYEKFAAGPLPDLTIRAAQIYLGFAGIDPHGVDGVLGPGTRAALQAFQTKMGLPVTGLADQRTMLALVPA